MIFSPPERVEILVSKFLFKFNPLIIFCKLLSNEYPSNAKNLYSVKIKDLVYGARINKVSLFDMFGYGLLSNWFADKGIFITDENREEKYMEVINMAAEMDNTETANQYVEKLTNMLDLRDKIEDTYGMYNIMNQYLASIDDAESVDEVKEIYDKALSEFK